jgi:hypothetical protein
MVGLRKFAFGFTLASLAVDANRAQLAIFNT